MCVSLSFASFVTLTGPGELRNKYFCLFRRMKINLPRSICPTSDEPNWLNTIETKEACKTWKRVRALTLAYSASKLRLWQLSLKLWLFCLVFIGRSVMLLWMGDAAVHELYTAACGLYIIWLVCRIGSVLTSWIPLGCKGVALKFFEWFLLVSSLWIYGSVESGILVKARLDS